MIQFNTSIVLKIIDRANPSFGCMVRRYLCLKKKRQPNWNMSLVFLIQSRAPLVLHLLQTVNALSYSTYIAYIDFCVKGGGRVFTRS